MPMRCGTHTLKTKRLRTTNGYRPVSWCLEWEGATWEECMSLLAQGLVLESA